MQIIIDLEEDGYITRERQGRRNRYHIDHRNPLRHPLEEHHDIGSLLEAVSHEPPPESASRQPVDASS